MHCIRKAPVQTEIHNLNRELLSCDFHFVLKFTDAACQRRKQGSDNIAHTTKISKATEVESLSR